MLTELHARKAVSINAEASVNGASTTAKANIRVVGSPKTKSMRLPTPKAWAQNLAAFARRPRRILLTPQDLRLSDRG
jgi:hypothetical protein